MTDTWFSIHILMYLTSIIEPAFMGQVRAWHQTGKMSKRMMKIVCFWKYSCYVALIGLEVATFLT